MQNKLPRHLLLLSLLLGMVPALVFTPTEARSEEGVAYPYELRTGTEAGLLLGAAAAFGLGWWQNTHLEPLIPEQVGVLTPGMVNSFDRPATGNWSPRAARYSDLLARAQLLAPLTLNLGEAGRLQPMKTTLIQVETMALSSGLTYLLKNTFRRSRPLVYNRDPRIPAELRTSLTARRSFPSGHTAKAFSSMVMMGSMFEQLNPDSGARPWVWAGCLGTAALTGVFRVTGGWHFTSDVLAGAALGSVVGWLVPRLHEIDRPGGQAPGATLTLSFGTRF